jgi:hypothetical protein
VVQVHRAIDKLSAKANVYVIGNGAPNFIAGFREQTGWQGPVYTDPSLKAYEAAHLERGFFKTFNPLAIGSTVRAFARGHRQGLTQGDQNQQGGVLVIGTDGVIKWQHISRRPGDNATPEEILEHL